MYYIPCISKFSEDIYKMFWLDEYDSAYLLKKIVCFLFMILERDMECLMLFSMNFVHS